MTTTTKINLGWLELGGHKCQASVNTTEAADGSITGHVGLVMGNSTFVPTAEELEAFIADVSKARRILKEELDADA